MLTKIKNSISKPGLVFAYIKDRAGQIIIYLLLMAFIMTLPKFIMLFKDKALLFPSNDVITQGINSNFNNQGIEIIDGTLIIPNNENHGFFINEYTVVLGSGRALGNGFFIHFKEDHISLYAQVDGVIHQNLYEIKYSDTNINNISFTNSNSNLIANEIVKVLSSQNFLIAGRIIGEFIYNMIQYLFMALMFAMVFRISIKLPIPFSANFKMSFYLMTIWALITLILTLFGLESLTFISFIFVYINHVRAFRSIRIVRRVGPKPKDEEK